MFRRFEETAVKAYLIIRKNANLFINLFSMVRERRESNSFWPYFLLCSVHFNTNRNEREHGWFHRTHTEGYIIVQKFSLTPRPPPLPLLSSPSPSVPLLSFPPSLPPLLSSHSPSLPSHSPSLPLSFPPPLSPSPSLPLSPPLPLPSPPPDEMHRYPRVA